MAQGTQRSNRPTVLEDLDAMIISRALKPGKVRLGGRYWTIKRDFTAEQVLRFWALVDQPGKSAEAYSMLVGAKDAAEFAAIISATPQELINPPLRQLFRLAGLLKRADPPTTDADADDVDSEEPGEGESSAS
jgi:hypothetical protein